MKSRNSIFSKFNHPKERIFLKREYHSVKGKKNGVLVLLTAILFFSLFSVVLGKAGLDYLNFKMNDPFIKWFNIPVNNYNLRGSYAEIKTFFDENASSGKYSFSESTGSYRSLWRFYPKKGGGTTAAFVQSFNFWKDKKLLKSILNEDNLVQSFIDEDNLSPEQLRDGVIISLNLLKDLQCEPADLEGNKIMVKDGDYLPLHVLAIVKSLPFKSHVFAENRLVFSLNQFGESNISGSLSAKRDSLSFYILASDEVAEKRVTEKIGAILESKSLTYEKAVVAPMGDGIISQNKRLAYYGLSKNIDLENARRINTKIAEDLYAFNPALVVHHSPLVPHESMKYGNTENEFGSAGNAASNKFDLLSFKLDDLSQISEFQDEVLNRFEMELDMSQVEAKRNFGVVSFMSIFLILSLVFFAGFAILIYLFNLIKGHLEKISVNLGTLLAFGLPKEFLYKGYLRIIFRLILSATLLALGLLTILIIAIHLSSSALNLPGFFGYMAILQNAWLWITIGVFFTVSFLLFQNLLKSFLSCPPGDLIYNR